jgi:hypothetical protein
VLSGARTILAGEGPCQRNDLQSAGASATLARAQSEGMP